MESLSGQRSLAHEQQRSWNPSGRPTRGRCPPAESSYLARESSSPGLFFWSCEGDRGRAFFSPSLRACEQDRRAKTNRTEPSRQGDRGRGRGRGRGSRPLQQQQQQ
ncbi:hypothetical protein GTR04_6245 [Trichophyton interdigitale]|nr:hypothetical protein GY631_4674 [Trichophyton interdigitale]KAG8206379.1 hypothetical protein GTR04_6245 [Trichophyton interdigitale]